MPPAVTSVDASTPFECISSFVSDGGIPVAKYRSKHTGLTIVVAQVEGPLVNGYFTLATEAHDDDGCPHTLEHIVFLGSELFPYKGVLDSAANRCLARGTNAWTDTDHTAYTLQTAGAEGFLNLLPVYLDHILYPTMTDSGFHTEVHHINGEGENAGVVYCEMQARENDCESRVHRKVLEKIWPGDCGFKSETGGIMANLRALTVDTVRKYHRDFYRPDNLCVIIVGKVETKAVFDALLPMEERIMKKGPLPPMVRPWTTPVPPVTESSDDLVEFPADDDTIGHFVLAWRGPDYADFLDYSALAVLWEYLTDSAISPLRKTFVEIDDAYCSSIDFSFITNSVIVDYVVFESVATEKLDEIKDKLFEVLRGIVAEGVDMARMPSVIHRQRLKHLASLEDRPSNALVFSIIGDYLYANDPDQLKDRLAVLTRLDALATKDSAYWIDLLRKYLLDRPHVCVRGKPSPSLGEEMTATEKERIAKQVEALGEAKLNALKDSLAAATASNEIETPPSVLAQFKVPDVTHVPRFDVTTYNAGSSATGAAVLEVAERLNQDSSAALPIWFQFDHFHSEFVTLSVALNSDELPEALRLYIEVYLQVIFEAPILRNGTLVPYEEVVAELNNDTLATESLLGFGGANFECGPFAQVAIIKIKCERAKYERGVQWLRELLWQTEFTPERLKIAASKLINEVPQYKRDGSKMCWATIHDVEFQQARSNISATNAVRQHRFLTRLVERLDSEPAAVATEITAFRTALTATKNLRVHVAGDAFSLEHPKLPWVSGFLPAEAAPAEPSTLAVPALSSAYVTQQVISPSSKAWVLALGAIESSFLVQSTRGPDSFEHPDIASLLVIIEYLTTMEGPFWKQIRGLGLSYSYGIRMDLEEGLLYFTLFKSGSLLKAYAEAARLISEFASDKADLDELRLEAARSSVLYGIISRESTPSSAASQRFMHYFRRVPLNYNSALLLKVQQVSKVDVQRVCKEHLVRLFNAPQTNLSITANPGKAAEIVAGFQAQGRDVMRIEDIDKFIS